MRGMGPGQNSNCPLMASEERALNEAIGTDREVGKGQKADSPLKPLKRPADTLILTSKTHFTVLNPKREENKFGLF